MVLAMTSSVQGVGRRSLRLVTSSAICLGLLAIQPAWSDDKGKLDQQLTTAYPLTTPTADNTDIVTPGVVLILQKRGLTTGDATSSIPFQNYYKDGQIKGGAASVVSKISHFGIPGIPSVPSNAVGNTATRTFVNGEKVYVTGIQINNNHIIFSLFSDAYDNVHYKGTLQFEFPKKVIESGDLAKVQATLDEVFKIDTSAAKGDAAAGGDQAAGGQAAAAPAAEAAPAAPPAAPAPELAPIAPPPPPADQPPAEIAVGQTPDQVTAILGQPQKVAKLTGKEIYFYKNLKVTFKNGKVTDVE